VCASGAMERARGGGAKVGLRAVAIIFSTARVSATTKKLNKSSDMGARETEARVAQMSVLGEISTNGAIPVVSDASVIEPKILDLGTQPKRKRIVSYWPFLLIGLSLAATLLWVGILFLLIRALIATI
jgi:hypothetical protein